jgi:hypothetical protein
MQQITMPQNLNNPTSMLVSKVGCDINVWDACEVQSEEEFSIIGAMQTKQQNSNNKIWVRTMTRPQNLGADNDKATEYGRAWLWQYCKWRSRIL